MSSPHPQTIDLSYIQIELLEKYPILRIKEGVVFDAEMLDSLYEIFDEYYPHEPFGYISDRKFDFTIDPTCYLKVSSHPRIKGIAVLCHKESSFNTAIFEKSFYDRPFEVFYSLEECEKWLQNHLT